MRGMRGADSVRSGAHCPTKERCFDERNECGERARPVLSGYKACGLPIGWHLVENPRS
jgi:hypothetical protein